MQKTNEIKLRLCPAISEAELKKKEESERVLASQQSGNSDEASKSTSTSATPTLPLSVVYKLFPVLPAQKARPIKYEPTKISFCHYRKRPSPVSSVSAGLYAPGNTVDKASTPCRSEHDEELSNDSFRNDDGDEGENGETMEERRHKCPIEGCNKRYKNLQGARYHARQVHGMSDDTTGRVTPIEAMSNTSGSQSPLTQPPTPSKCANSGMVNKPLISSNQMAVTISSAHVSSVSTPGMRVTSAQPLQTAPPPTAAGHQYHSQQSSLVAGNQPTTTANIQVRAVGTISGSSRAGNVVESRISYGTMLDGSQQSEQRTAHGVPPKVPQRVVSAGNLSVLSRTQYQQNQPVMHRVKMSTNNANGTLGTQVVNVQSAQASNSAVSPSQSNLSNRSQVFQSPQQHQQIKFTSHTRMEISSMECRKQ
uniref:C2H2-type domain-containing protein n=1 Tax=Ascaris lumbricoides TaxID=6252 RepID=A0A9J2PQK2_ASCLU